MSFGFPAHHRQEINHALPLKEAQERARQLAAGLKWQLIGDTDAELKFRVRVSWWSWGEEVKMSFFPTAITVESKCRIITQCFDHGKNKRNCACIAEAYEN